MLAVILCAVPCVVGSHERTYCPLRFLRPTIVFMLYYLSWRSGVCHYQYAGGHGVPATSRGLHYIHHHNVDGKKCSPLLTRWLHYFPRQRNPLNAAKAHLQWPHHPHFPLLKIPIGKNFSHFAPLVNQYFAWKTWLCKSTQSINTYNTSFWCQLWGGRDSMPGKDGLAVVEIESLFLQQQQNAAL